MIRHAAIAIICAALFFSCKKDVLVSDHFDIENAQWVVNDQKSISFEVTDTTRVYQMDLEVDHKADFGFQNLYVKMRTTFPSGKEQESITSLELSGPGGTWVGDCNKKRCSLTLPLQQKFTFPEAGRYTWSIEPYMRSDTVYGIEGITVRCSKIAG